MKFDQLGKYFIVSGANVEILISMTPKYPPGKVCIRIMLYQQILSRATPKCGEQLKCDEQKYIEDILNDRWQHHIQRQVLGIFAVYNF